MAAEKACPCPLELEVASALLLLSSTTTPPSFTLSPPPPEKINTEKKKKKKSSVRFAIQKSNWSGSSSTVTTDNEQQLNVITVVAKFHEMLKLNVVRKRRSKSLCISDCRRISSGMAATKTEDSAPASSCLSNGSNSVISCARSRDVIRKREKRPLTPTPTDKSKRKPALSSGHMRRRAEAILKMLSSHGCASEVRIRTLLGDSPSTSKALRILLNLAQVKRLGAGGRSDPYVYSIA